MRLPAFALFERSLRVETRSPLMCWSRFGLLAMVLLVLFPIQTSARMGWSGAPGLSFLQEMVWINFVFITLAGLSYFASAITEEKEEMMLGLLRMTDLNGVAILLGKSTSRLVGALLLLLVQVPFILLAITLGGVGLQQIAAAYGTLLAYLFLVCNLALLFSVILRNTSKAAAFTFIVLLTFLLGHYWAKSLLDDAANSGYVRLNGGLGGLLSGAIVLWGKAAPPNRLVEIFRTGFAGPVVGFQIVSNLVLGVLFFLLSWLVFDRCTRDEKESSPVRLWFRRRTARRSRIPQRLTGLRAVSWKDFTFISGGKMGLLIKFGVIGFLVLFFNVLTLKYGDKNTLTREFEGGILIWISLVVTAVCLALEAAHVFQEEIRWKTLSSLVTLPMSIPELAYRKVLGALAGTLPLLSVTVIGALVVPDGVGKFFDDITRSTEGFGVLVVMILQFILFLHLTAFLSFIVKRGALPLAIVIQYIGGSFFTGFLGVMISLGGGGGRSGGFLFIVAFICIIATIFLHIAIGNRLARAAAEE